MQQSQTVILFFSRTEHEEYKVNNLGMTKAAFHEFYHTQVAKTLAIAKSTGFPLEQCYSNQQQGSSFGERLQFALNNLKNKGYKSVIVLGNDTPLLNEAHVLQASERLKAGDNLIGQDQHGGAWIIALQLQAQLIKGITELHWQSDALYEELRHYLNLPTELESSFDINKARDIKVLTKLKSTSRAFKRWIRSFYKGNWGNLVLGLSRQKSLIQYLDLRGPPTTN